MTPARAIAVACGCGALLVTGACERPDEQPTALTAEQVEQVIEAGEPESEAGGAIRYEFAGDGMPTGESSPEGIACDYLRARLDGDAGALYRCCAAPAGTDEQRRAYDEGIQRMGADMQRAKAPERWRFVTLYESRPLVMAGPPSELHRRYGWEGVRFVDVTVERSGTAEDWRVLVVRAGERGWRVVADPRFCEECLQGLAQETESLIEFGSEDSVYRRSAGG